MTDVPTYLPARIQYWDDIVANKPDDWIELLYCSKHAWDGGDAHPEVCPWCRIDLLRIERATLQNLVLCERAWPEAVNGEYNPACCRFPKSCSIPDDSILEVQG